MVVFANNITMRLLIRRLGPKSIFRSIRVTFSPRGSLIELSDEAKEGSGAEILPTTVFHVQMSCEPSDWRERDERTDEVCRVAVQRGRRILKSTYSRGNSPCRRGVEGRQCEGKAGGRFSTRRPVSGRGTSCWSDGNWSYGHLYGVKE